MAAAGVPQQVRPAVPAHPRQPKPRFLGHVTVSQSTSSFPWWSSATPPKWDGTLSGSTPTLYGVSSYNVPPGILRLQTKWRKLSAQKRHALGSLGPSPPLSGHLSRSCRSGQMASTNLCATVWFEVQSLQQGGSTTEMPARRGAHTQGHPDHT